jgi:hypothetical protein
MKLQERTLGHAGILILQPTQLQIHPFSWKTQVRLNSVNPSLQIANLDVVWPECLEIKIFFDNHDPSLSQRSKFTTTQWLWGQDLPMVAWRPFSPAPEIFRWET